MHRNLWGVRGTFSVLATALATACTAPPTFHCEANEDCGSDGVCEDSHYCSFSDEACKSHRRYGPGAGDDSEQCTLDPAKLIAHWRLDGDAIDELGMFDGESMDYVNDALVRSPLPYVQGPTGMAADFSNIGHSGNQHIRVTSDSREELEPGTLDPDQLSLSFWMRRPRSSGAEVQFIVGKGRLCMSHYGCRLVGDDELQCAINAGTDWCGGAIYAAIPLTSNAWQHIVFTVSRHTAPAGVHLKVYRNGLLEATVDVEESHPVGVGEDLRQYFLFGRNYVYDGTEVQPDVAPQIFAGQLADVRLYDGVLSADQVVELYSTP